LVLSPGPPTPGMTFELRFEEPMVAGDHVGVAANQSPLVVVPALPGTFSWLSPRSGVFTPSEALAMDTPYTLSLRRGLRRADGQRSKAVLRWIVRTPPLSLTAFWPQQADSNSPVEPEIKLVFNAEVRAADASGFASFRDREGRRIAADVRQGMLEELPPSYEFGGFGTFDTWQQQFAARRPHPLNTHSHRRGAARFHSPDWIEAPQSPEPTNLLDNLLIVTPRRPLPLGNDWRLVLRAGLATVDRSLRLPQPAEVPVGDVTPFVVNDVDPQNYILRGASIRLLFSKPIPNALTNHLSDWLELKPSPTNLSADVNGSVVTLGGDFQGGVSHTLGLRPGFRSTEGFALTGSNNFVVKIPHVAPRLYFPAFSRDQLAGGNRSFPLLAVNVPKVRLRAKVLEPQTVIHALRGYASYEAYSNERYDKIDWSEPYRALNYNLVPGRTVFNEEFDLPDASDTSTRYDLCWDSLLQGRKAAVVFLDAERAAPDSDGLPALGTQALIQLTDLGLVWKRSPAGVDVFVFSHSDGQPVAGATARLLTGENETLAEAVTDGNGQTCLAAATNADWLSVQYGADLHAVPLKENVVSRYGFDLPSTSSEASEDPRRVMLFSDRPLYRPGEQLRLEALVRDWGADGLSIPAGLCGTFQCIDARGRRFFQTNAVFDSTGAWSIAVALPNGARGTYTARLGFGTNEYTYSAYQFQVQDFQPNAFEVALPCPPAFAAGEKIALPLSARYLFGKPLSRAQVKWSLEAEDGGFAPTGFEAFSFSRAAAEARFGRGSSSVTLAGEGVLLAPTNSGTPLPLGRGEGESSLAHGVVRVGDRPVSRASLMIEPDVPLNLVAPQPRAVSLLVEVTDLNQQTVSRRVEFVRHSSEFYLGLRQGAAVLTSSNDLPLEVVALNARGKPWPEPVRAHLSLQRIQWHSVPFEGAGRTIRYHDEAVLTNVLEQDIEVQPVQAPTGPGEKAVGNRIEALPPLPAGEYLLEARAADSALRPVVTSLSFSVSAPGEMSWNYRNEVQLTLRPDRKVYAPGEVAEILVESPFSGTALVSVERENVLRSFVTHLEGNAPSIRVPIGASDLPNVFVCVALVRGADNCPHKTKQPEYRVGYCSLDVEDPQSRLTVTVSPGATNYLPGQPVGVGVRVTDREGRGMPGAHLVLYAVDDGILGLSDRGLPNPHSFFYATRALSVDSSVSLPNLLAEDPAEQQFANKGYLGGGGGCDGLRKNFLACAYWNTDRVTDAEGNATARFTAPDSLTRYRLVAVAHAGASQFGNAEAAFQVSKPLMIEPALPSFANITDRILARGLVHNQTARDSEVVATLELDGTARAAEAEATLRRIAFVPANGSIAIDFPVEFTEAGQARWVWKARFTVPGDGDFTDAVESRIEVGHIAPVLREVRLDHTTESTANLLAHANPQLLAGQGTITVTVANSRLNDLGEAVAQLLHYPYGCVEQTGSSLLPWIVLRDDPRFLPMLGHATNDPESVIRAGIARLFTMQTPSGGLGYWPGASEPMLWASAYGGMVLGLAERHGVPVPKEEFDSLLKFISQQLRKDGAGAGELSEDCLALYALALAGRAEPAYHEKLFNLRARLSTEDRALLALAIAESHGPDQMIGALLEAASVSGPLDEEHFGCEARQQAISLLAWSRYRPDSPRLDELVSDLMRDQQEAHWGTTQGDAWALLALTDYARRIEPTVQPAEGRLTWGGRSFDFHLDGQTSLFTQSFGITNLPEDALGLSDLSGQRLFTSVCLEGRPAETPQPRQEHGFSLQRHYQRLDDENQPLDLRGLAVGDRVLVTLHLRVREPARYVAVDDPLPAILEAVNPEFKTRETRSAEAAGAGSTWWPSDFRELRKDRCLSFANWVGPGNYTLCYVARVRAAGTATAPSAKVEEMYHPERFGLSETQVLKSEAEPAASKPGERAQR